MNQEHPQNIYHVSANVTLTVENLTQIKRGITVNADVNVKTQKNIVYPKNKLFGTLFLAFAKMVNI